MKKNLKKLALSRETLHNLTAVRGGALAGDGIVDTGCGSECSACGRVCEAAPLQPAQPVQFEKAAY